MTPLRRVLLIALAASLLAIGPVTLKLIRDQPGEPTIYTVDAIVHQLRSHPHDWLGRTVLLTGEVQNARISGWLGSPSATSSYLARLLHPPKGVEVELFLQPLGSAAGPPRTGPMLTLTPDLVGTDDPLARLEEAFPALDNWLAPGKDATLADARLYSVKLEHNDPTCVPGACFRGLLLGLYR